LIGSDGALALGLALAKGYNMVILRMDDKRWFIKGTDLIDIAKPFLFSYSQSLHVNPQNP
jgi:hypothetical protein